MSTAAGVAPHGQRPITRKDCAVMVVSCDRMEQGRCDRRPCPARMTARACTLRRTSARALHSFARTGLRGHWRLQLARTLPARAWAPGSGSCGVSSSRAAHTCLAVPAVMRDWAHAGGVHLPSRTQLSDPPHRRLPAHALPAAAAGGHEAPQAPAAGVCEAARFHTSEPSANDIAFPDHAPSSIALTSNVVT